MKLLETSYLVDFERKEPSAEEFFSENEYATLTASTVSMFELAYGVVGETDRDLSELIDSLQWVDFLEFTVPDAIEGAHIQAELEASGNRIPIGDMLIAGVARNRGATLVAADDHFEAIEGLTTERYR